MAAKDPEIREGQIDWRNLPNANGKTWWELNPDEPNPYEGGKTYNQLQKTKDKPGE
jgi:hypothetical protein